jgi:CheY-like chemotaxis protein
MNPIASELPSAVREPILLVVDDNAVNRRVAVAFARRLGWGAVEAGGGEAALALLAGTSFDLVLLDISMPGMSGQEVLTRLRKIPAPRRLKVVAYTAHALLEETRQILEAGFDGLLIKPISLQALADVLEATRVAE